MISKYSVRLVLLMMVFGLGAKMVSAENPKHVNVKLVADVSEVEPGGTFKLGAYFEIDPHWHIYWKNPGDSGLPTTIDYTASGGVTIDNIKWPVPKTFSRAGEIVDFGYEENVMIISDVTVTDDAKPGAEVQIRGQVKWLSCEEICIPGAKEVQLSIKVSKESRAANTNLFNRWKKLLPLSVNSPESPFDIEFGGITKKGDKLNTILTLTAKAGVEIQDLYIVPEHNLVIQSITLKKNGGGGKTTISVDAEMSADYDGPNGIETLLAYGDQNGKRAGVELLIPIVEVNKEHHK